MKQTTNKMFKGCPYEKENFENCSMCPNYKHCLEMKEDRIHKKKMQQMQRMQWLMVKLIVVLLALLFVLGIVNLIILINTNSKIKENNGVANEILDVMKDDTSNSIKNTEEDILDSTENNKTSIPETIEPTKEPDESTYPKAELSAYGPSDTYYYDISYEDKVTIAKVVWAEARGESFEGKVAVAAVIINRYYSGISYFDTESIYAVATQPYQFASIENVTIEKLEANPDCMKAVEAACKGWDPTRAMFSKGALYFYAPKYVSGYQAEIREGIRVLVIGNHNFHYDFEKVE